jgi:hypothetical protein
VSVGRLHRGSRILQSEVVPQNDSIGLISTKRVSAMPSVSYGLHELGRSRTVSSNRSIDSLHMLRQGDSQQRMRVSLVRIGCDHLAHHCRGSCSERLESNCRACPREGDSASSRTAQTSRQVRRVVAIQIFSDASIETPWEAC